ncbi:hypothetical protein BU24DRAFT_459448 [Aaosphaeria arxii CBS 175.79]|uniref:Uncharacterized protein n=1 Tax=Aaosphaeria arxii CBS 175.79 TaxID=1450172 RepID=A0A6A5Y3G0_9PLEO|nr:uncharacterized protein BU24DRAFT_459448 [Aaosphaeria arxii CBS 175.79]KAF2019819.1 hypothetical protein BU24DRAFT_459448 [Aaosphaeria arxii CBS 175.79]
MFKRHRAAAHPLPQQPPNASASLAASKAFMKNRESNGALSSAAAAAALRTHTTSPTPVGDTITKRMVRKASTSSQGSGSQQHPGLRRHSSSGSMTERSFRAPSPSRTASSIDRHHDAPPVPAVPKHVPTVSTAHRRASSLEPTNRGGSPVARGGGRGVSLDRGVAGSPLRTQAHSSSYGTGLTQVPEDDADGNSRSVNFSRPISPPPAPSSPRPASANRGGHGGWHAGPIVNPNATFRGSNKSRTQNSEGSGDYTTYSTQQSIQNATNRPVSTNRNDLAHGVEGARLATGSMRARPSGTSVQSQIVSHAPPQPVDPKSPYAVYDPSSRTFIHKQAAMQRFRALSEEDVSSPPEYMVHSTPPSQPRQAPHPRVSIPAPTPQPPQYQAAATPSPPATHHSETRTTQEQPHAPGPRYQEESIDRREPVPNLSPLGGANMLARQRSEDFAGSDIRPSVDTNAKHIQDKAEPTTIEESPVSPNFAPNQDSAYPRISTPTLPPTTDDVAPKGRGSNRSDRTQSLSPPRNAHFAAINVELSDGVRHHPPPRSVSPAKSALKPSPSVSRRNSSPIANNGRVSSIGPSSEASDTTSDDGTRRKKKNVRVSFDEEAVVAGTSAYAEAETPSSPTGLGHSKWSPQNQEQDPEDFMTPRPVLPSFGSIRNRHRRDEEVDTPEKVTETVSSSMSTSVASMKDSHHASSDHAIGGILVQDFAAKRDPNEPLPPEVTTVEGTGYGSESDSSSGTGYDEIVAQPVQNSQSSKPEARSVPALEPKTLTTPAQDRNVPIQVPAIAVQPASPSPKVEKPEPLFDLSTPTKPISSDSTNGSSEIPSNTVAESHASTESKVHRPVLPGAWDEDEESEAEHEPEQAPETKSSAKPQITIQEPPKPIGIYGGSGIRHHQLSTLEEDDSSDDDSSIYSDAYEDLEEDGGFASIDAVVESPIVGPTSGLMSSKYADHGLRNTQVAEATSEVAVTKHEKAKSSEKPTNDWLEEQQRINEPASLSKRPQTPAERKPEVAAVAISSEPTIVTKSPPPPSQQPRKSAMKKKTAAPPSPTSAQPKQIRQTMRGTSGAMGSHQTVSSGGHMRMSMRGSEPSSPRASTGLAASRYSNAPPARGALQKRNMPATGPVLSGRPQSAAANAASRPKTAPAPTYDDDSDASASSFQRQRPRPRGGDSSRYTMRASMRGNAASSSYESHRPRSLSPVGKPSSPPPTMRRSMRPSSPTPEVKSSRFSIRSLSPAGRFRPGRTVSDDAPPVPRQPSPPKKSNKVFGKKQKPPAAPVSKPSYKSRFVDSSDEDEEYDRPRRFQSRFVDSDEEDYQLPPDLAPVRGIPKRAGEDDDSTDLEEELDDELSPAKVPPTDEKQKQVTNGHTNGHVAFTANALHKSQHAPTDGGVDKKKAKRGFFGLGKKKQQAQPPVTEPTVEHERSDATDIPYPPEQRNRTLSPIGEDEDKAFEANPAPRSPKLQRRSQPNRTVSDSWPLPGPPSATETARPQSSDGMPGRRISMRPTLSKRHSSQTADTKPTMDRELSKDTIVGRTGKKKKFQGLRRVFGLND